MMNEQDRLEKLKKIIGGYGSLLVAYSGGVDSTFLLAVATDVLKEKVVAVIGASAIHPEPETRFAVETARKLGVRHRVLETQEIDMPDFISNDPNRCYVCKKNLLVQLKDIAAELDLAYVAHGANMDDLDDFRPGFAAAREMRVVSPLIEAGFTKSDVRRHSKQMGLETWNKPAIPCLATRLPYGTPITVEVLEQVAAAEDVLRRHGFVNCRLRHHGALARIEVDPDEFSILLADKTRLDIVSAIKALGYPYVSLDLEGYCQGSMNRGIVPDSEEK